MACRVFWSRRLASFASASTSTLLSTRVCEHANSAVFPRLLVSNRESLVRNLAQGGRSFSATTRMPEEEIFKGQSIEKHEEWKKRPPYSVHAPNDKFKARYEAACHCGKVKYQLSREEPLDSKLCHCTTCQTQHAAPFQWAAIFHKEDINFTHGHHGLEWYDPTDKSIEHKLPCKVRCAYCHSPIMDEGRNMILLFPSLVHLKTEQDKLNFKPRLHMFYEQRVMDIPDGLPKWSGINEDSELIEDSPPELVRENERSREEQRAKRFKAGENK